MNTPSYPIHFRKTPARRGRKMTAAAMLAAMAYMLAFLEFPVPLSPAFARMDFSDLPALAAALTLGPLSGLLVELLKNLLGLLTTGTGGVGELANFLMGGALVLAAGTAYHRFGRGAGISCLLGSLAMALTAALANYFLLLPLFEQFMPLDALIASFGEFIPFIHTKLDIVLFNAFPFNLLKGLGISAVTCAVFPKLLPALRGSLYNP